MRKTIDYTLLYFDETAAAAETGTPSADSGKTATTPDPRDEKKYSDKDYDAFKLRVKAEFEKKEADRIKKAEEEKAAATKRASEAAKMAKMNELEKAQYQLAAAQKELDELKRDNANKAMAAEVRSMLDEAGIRASDKMISYLVREDADSTKEVVDEFIKTYNEDVQKGIVSKVSQKAPRTASNAGTGVTIDDIFKEKDPRKQQEMILANPHLFKNAHLPTTGRR